MFAGKQVLVIGMARSGRSAAKVLAEQGAKVTLNDSKSLEELGSDIEALLPLCEGVDLGGSPQNVTSYDVIVLSPGVPTDLPFLLQAKDAGVHIMGEIELAFLLSKGTWLGITGTNGKTTTTALTGEMFENANRKHFVVGNIGVPAVEKAPLTTGETVLVTELSSFQLESIHKFHARVAAILNLTPDHLNRHKTMEQYAEAKCRIFENQTASDFAILNYDQADTWELRNCCKGQVIPFSRKSQLERGAYVADGILYVREEGQVIKICETAEIGIRGPHNLENALAATAMAFYSGIDPATIAQTLKTFKSIAHRTEPIAVVDGVQYINDSKGTNPDASIVAVQAMDVPTVLIAGGMDKGSDFTSFIGAFTENIQHMIVLGETAGLLKQTAEKAGYQSVIVVKDMEEAVQKAAELAVDGGNVLFSPACASWDMYPSYEHRGDHFRACVEALKEQS